eukprot:gene17137-biopygen5942
MATHALGGKPGTVPWLSQGDAPARPPFRAELSPPLPAARRHHDRPLTISPATTTTITMPSRFPVHPRRGAAFAARTHAGLPAGLSGKLSADRAPTVLGTSAVQMEGEDQVPGVLLADGAAAAEESPRDIACMKALIGPSPSSSGHLPCFPTSPQSRRIPAQLCVFQPVHHLEHEGASGNPVTVYRGWADTSGSDCAARLRRRPPQEPGIRCGSSQMGVDNVNRFTLSTPFPAVGARSWPRGGPRRGMALAALEARILARYEPCGCAHGACRDPAF